MEVSEGAGRIWASSWQHCSWKEQASDSRWRNLWRPQIFFDPEMDHKDLVGFALRSFGSLCFCDQGKLFTVFSASNYCGLTGGGAGGGWMGSPPGGPPGYSPSWARQPGSCVDLEERQPGHLEVSTWRWTHQAATVLTGAVNWWIWRVSNSPLESCPGRFVNCKNIWSNFSEEGWWDVGQVCARSQDFPAFFPLTIWLWLTSPWKNTNFHGQINYFYGPSIPWQTVSHNQVG